MKHISMMFCIRHLSSALKKQIRPISRYLSSRRMMASDHMDKTADSVRNEIISLATVVGMRDESKTVKSLTLKVDDSRLTFKAGQWVDMFIPGVETVGGFSMHSSPLKLEKEHSLDLAVKYSKHPPAHWIHTKCQEGDQVKIRVGGDFFFDPTLHRDNDLLLIAGGVGINPLFSIINEVVDINKGSKSDVFSGRVTLLYSARSMEELVFKEQLSEIHSNNENIMCQFHVTREGDMFTKFGNVFLLGQRINSTVVPVCFDWLDKEKTLVYICGPSHMIEDMEKSLTELDVPEPYLRTGLNDFPQYVSTATHTLGDTLGLIISPLQHLDTVTKPVPYTDHHLIAVKLDCLQSG